jgi:peroxiredoxin
VSVWSSWKVAVIGLGVGMIVVASFVVPKALNKNSVSAGAEHAMAMGAQLGAGLPVGSRVPSFSERNLETGQAITSRTVYGHKTLLFFSEGIMCQACFQQIKDIEAFGKELRQRGISLVSITPDPPGDLRQVVDQIGITSPMISDENRAMSEAFNTLGKGMHADTPGHAFALIYRGKVLWYRDYWLPPYQTMYVKPSKLLKDIPA